MYNIGDFVIYRRNVCRIKDHKEINNTKYYIIVPIDDPSLTITIPTDNKNGLLRDPISKEEANKLINRIPEISTIENIDDKYIESTYKNLINTGEHEDLIKIIKTTYLRNKSRLDNKKKISEKDNNYFNLAEKYLYNELSVSLDLTIPETKDYIIKKVEELLTQ